MSFGNVFPTPRDKKLLGDESVERLLNIVWFNLSRKEKTNELKEIFEAALEKIKRRTQMNHDPIKTIEYLEMILCIIAYTRDIKYGKGERDLTYMMIYTLYSFFPIPAIYLIKEIVGQNEESYGSWKDIPRLCDYIKKETNEHNPLIITLVEMAIHQLKSDKDRKSNVAKWIPRENSKYGWLFDIFVKNYYQLSTNPNNTNRSNFRKLISKTNRAIETAEINFCEKKEVDETGLNYDTRLKYWNKLREIPFNKLRSKHAPIKDLNYSIPIDIFIKKAKRITENLDIKKLDDQWIKYSKQWSTLNKYIIPLIDVSTEMTEYEYNTAIGIGILLSQNSMMKNRLICFSQTASWISLNTNLGFTNTVKEIINTVPPPTSRLINTGFKLIKEAILETKMEKDQIDNLEIVVVSNFANDSCHDYNFNENITEKKIKTIPNLTYWNISQNLTILNKEKDEGEGERKRIKYIAGQVSLDEFISNKTKMETIKKILSNPRYDKIRNMFENIIH